MINVSVANPEPEVSPRHQPALSSHQVPDVPETRSSSPVIAAVQINLLVTVMSQPSPIRVFPSFADTAFFSGEEFTCTLTFTNTTELPSPSSSPLSPTGRRNGSTSP